jgi:hypothetical protein
MEMLSLLLGAGFSKWAAGCPLASELFDFKIEPKNQLEPKKLDRLKRIKTDWDQANPTLLAEAFVTWAINESVSLERLVSWYVTRRVSDEFLATIEGGIQTFQINERRAREHHGVIKAQRFLTRFLGGDVAGILTTNYDLLVEYAFTTDRFNYGTRGEILQGRGHNPRFFSQGRPVILTGELPLAKLHGSVSWTDDSKFTDGRCGLKGNALIVPPFLKKRAPDQLKAQWTLARSIIRDASKIVVFGFGFNRYDSEVLNLLAEGSGNIRDALLIDPNPQTEMARKLWPQATIRTCLPAIAPDFRWKEWL